MVIYFTNSTDKRKRLESFWGGFTSPKLTHLDLGKILEKKYSPYSLFAKYLKSQLALVALNSLGKANTQSEFQRLMADYLKSYWLKWLAQSGGHTYFSKVIEGNPTPLIDTAQFWKNLYFKVNLNNVERHKLSLYLQGRINKLQCYQSFSFKVYTDPVAR